MSTAQHMVLVTADELEQLVRKAVRAELEARGGEEATFLNRAEVAKLLNTSEKTVFRLIRQGLPAEKLGAEWRFERAKVLEFIRTRKAAG